MMKRPAAPMEVARRLLASVAGEAQRPEELADAAQAAYQQLRERLVVLLGQGGFDALWAHALRQTRIEARL